MTIPTLSSDRCTAEMAKRVARALNVLGADGDLLGTDTDALLELIDEYLTEDDDHEDNQGSPTLTIIQ